MWLAWRAGCPLCRPIDFHGTVNSPPGVEQALNSLIEWFVELAGELYVDDERRKIDSSERLLEAIESLSFWVETAAARGVMVALSVRSRDYIQLVAKIKAFYDGCPHDAKWQDLADRHF